MSEKPEKLSDSGIRWLGLSLLVIVFDQLTKWWALTALEPYIANEVFPGFNLTLAFNTGAAFSFLSDASGWQRWGLSGLAVVIVTILLVWLRRVPRADWRSALPLTLIIGGAIGNLVDRLRFGHVVDFIDVYYDRWHWPTFNIADSAISVGVVFLILFGLRAGGKNR